MTAALWVVLAIFHHAGVHAQPPGGGQGPGQGSAECSNPSCDNPPCAAALLGNVGCTTVSGTETYAHELIEAGGTIASNAHIFGPFEAGFTSRQDSIIANWGCSDPSVVYDEEGGKDIGIAEAHVAHECNVEFPRIVGDTYYGAVGECGGHTNDYHFHARFKCLYTETGAHSTKVGEVGPWNIYGKWEDYDNQMLPYLDACGGHFGRTPESPNADIYHYHVQDRAPFTVGCHGPSASNGLVSLAECRSLYNTCGDGLTSVSTNSGNVDYDIYCPCYDATGSSVDTQELPALSTSDISYSAGGDVPSPAPSPVPVPTPSPSPVPVPTPSPSPVPTPTPIATEHTCGDIKEAYRQNFCCGYPEKPFSFPSRRLSAIPSQDISSEGKPDEIVRSVERLLQATKAKHGHDRANQLAKEMEDVMARFNL